MTQNVTATNASSSLERQLDSLLEGQLAAGARNAVARIEAPAAGFAYEHAVGVAREDTGEAMTPRHRFHTASVSKSMTALLVLQLAEEGALGRAGVDARYVEFEVFPDDVQERLLTRGGRPAFAGVTLRHMLTHTSGFRDAFVDDGSGTSKEIGRPAPGSIIGSDATRNFTAAWSPWLPDGDTMEVRGVVNFYLSQPGITEALSEPGAAFHYSDTAFVLLALLVERVTGESYHANLGERILTPCDLQDSYLAYRDDPPLGPRRQPESDVHAYGIPMLSSGKNLSFDWGGGGLVTTARDLVRFQRALAENRLPGSSRILPEMTAWSRPAGLAEPRTGVGLGLFRTRYPGGELWGHSGAWGAKMDCDQSLGIYFAGTINRAGAPADWHHALIAAVAEHIR
ncbi:MAG: beta-lactamase family protein [Holophagales bacterium]|nr:beta-lactamase family protein [Holophagales bacterium]MYC08994.1 beta-lactamase family protein [Holophagales bacterium]